VKRYVLLFLALTATHIYYTFNQSSGYFFQESTSLFANPVQTEKVKKEPDLYLGPNRSWPDQWREVKGVSVLCFHHIVKDENLKDADYIALSESEYRAIMKWLFDNGYKTISEDILIKYLNGEILPSALPEKPVVLTFDDGYNDFVKYGRKINLEYKQEVILFSYPSITLVNKKRAITWDQYKQLIREGFVVESHSFWHPYLNMMEGVDQEKQFRLSKEILESHLGIKVETLAYPYGIYSAESLELLQNNGYKAAYTTFRGQNIPGTNPYFIQRLIVRKDHTIAQIKKILETRIFPFQVVNGYPGMNISMPSTFVLKVPHDIDATKISLSARNIFTYVKEKGQFSPLSVVYDSATSTLTSKISNRKKNVIIQIKYQEAGMEYINNILFNVKEESRQKKI